MQVRLLRRTSRARGATAAPRPCKSVIGVRILAGPLWRRSFLPSSLWRSMRRNGRRRPGGRPVSREARRILAPWSSTRTDPLQGSDPRATRGGATRRHGVTANIGLFRRSAVGSNPAGGMRGIGVAATRRASDPQPSVRIRDAARGSRSTAGRLGAIEEIAVRLRAPAPDSVGGASQQSHTRRHAGRVVRSEASFEIARGGPRDEPAIYCSAAIVRR